MGRQISKCVVCGLQPIIGLFRGQNAGSQVFNTQIARNKGTRETGWAVGNEQWRPQRRAHPLPPLSLLARLTTLSGLLRVHPLPQPGGL